MDDFYSREITLADMPFLMHEFEEGAYLSHFTNEIITPVGSSILAVDQISSRNLLCAACQNHLDTPILR